jgi:hypothetical protein
MERVYSYAKLAKNAVGMCNIEPTKVGQREPNNFHSQKYSCLSTSTFRNKLMAIKSGKSNAFYSKIFELTGFTFSI